MWSPVREGWPLCPQGAGQVVFAKPEAGPEWHLPWAWSPASILVWLCGILPGWAWLRDPKGQNAGWRVRGAGGQPEALGATKSDQLSVRT